jgi:hypothetical protein
MTTCEFCGQLCPNMYSKTYVRHHYHQLCISSIACIYNGFVTDKQVEATGCAHMYTLCTVGFYLFNVSNFPQTA